MKQEIQREKEKKKMHDIKYIRDNFDTFKKKIKNRNNNAEIDNI